MSETHNNVLVLNPSTNQNPSHKIYPSLDQVKLNSDNEENICRICLESEISKQKFIRPCKCSGSVRFVHEECLKSWLVSLNKELDGSKCEICSTKYKMNFIIKRKFLPRESFKNGGAHCFFIPILVTVMVMLFIIVYLLAKKYLVNESTTEQKAYTIALTLVCSIAGIIMIGLTINSLKEACFTPKMESWKILSQVFVEEIELNEENLNKFEEMRKLPMVIPKKTKVKGKSVKVPELKPMLTPISRSNKIVAFSPKYYTPVHSNMAKANLDRKLEKVFKY